ncbi:MAG: hypothetical protein DCC59_10855 [Chloroflexi bacterium]|nr:DUF87 domain-containing protein [Anaerolineales bacterium]RIK52117.1 MAG: hypothetical protein DCC59_10855 [Chloroflexota bacterium]
MTDLTFYLGRYFDPKTAKLTNKDLNYDSADLTTHAVVTGMTGSGKTGLCVALLEEAALNGIPAVIIDPKGDLTNLLLHFPELLPQDFQPWIDPEVARRANMTPEKAAQEAAEAWGDGLKEWGMTQERIMDLKNSVKFSIYTPGSNSGIPVSVLSSLDAPGLNWEENREAIREKIASTVTALLGLVGMNDLDPIRSREHILLSNIFEEHWSQGRGLELDELILQTQNPPFDKLGAFSVNDFFPQKDRTELAMTLNNILAAPAFESWREGESLDVQSLLFTADGQPRHSIFYLAHLSDGERMFFTTLLLSAVETWMRAQKGSASLRALLYMDEIYGYLPPTANPPSKQPLLRMLKQARAFGLGILLATQNPVDLDYKALSNTGTWFIGKLQTERDKLRLLDGLENLAGGISRAQMDKLISSLGKRVFVMNNVHNKEPVLFQTRWVMNFLAGPMTRNQIPQLNELVGAKEAAPRATPQPVSAPEAQTTPPPVDHVQPVAVPVAATQPKAQTPPRSVASASPSNGTATKPNLPAGIREYFLPQNYSLPEAFNAAGKAQAYGAAIQGVIYRPVLLASAQIRILDRKFGVDTETIKTALVPNLDRRGIVRWEEFPYAGPSLDKLETMAAPSSKFASIEAPLNDSKLMTALQKDFTDWVFRNSSVTARVNKTLKVFAGPDVSQADFMKACADTARESRDAEIEKKTAALEKKIRTLEDKLGREHRELREDEAELQNRNIESGANLLELGASVFGLTRKKSVTTQITKHRLVQSAKAEVQESQEVIAKLTQDLKLLEREQEQIIAEINDKWGRVVGDVSETIIAPKKTDIYVNIFGVAWMPYYQVQAGGEAAELAAFGGE